MLLQCLVERDGDSEVTAGGFKFTFRKNDAGHSVCDVLADGVRAHLLHLPWFREYEPEHPFKLTKVQGRDPETKQPLTHWEATLYGTDLQATAPTRDAALAKAHEVYEARRLKVPWYTPPLSERDQEILRLAAAGSNDEEIGKAVGLSRSRVNILRKELGCR